MDYQPSPETRARILAMTQGRIAPTRIEHARRRLRWLALSSLPLGLVALASRPWRSEWPLPRQLALGVVLAGSVAGLSLLGRSGPAVMGRSRGGLLGFALSVPLSFALAMVLVFGASAGASAWFDPTHRHCLLMSLVLSLFPLGASVSLARGADPVHPVSLGVAYGAISGAWAGTAMVLLCPRVDLPHLLVAHGVPLLALAGLGGFIGARWLALRGPSR
jgi:hypothetical protein